VYRYLKAHYIGFRKLKPEFGLPALVHVNVLTRCGLVALLLKYYVSVPYVITEHWSRYLPSRNSYRGILRKWLTSLVVRQSYGMVTVSEALKKAMIDHGLDHSVFRVIPNSVDTSVFVPGSDPPNGKKIISHISCFDDKAKNISGIIRSVHQLSKKRNDFEFHLIGDGPDRRRMEALSRSLDLYEKVIFFEGLLEGRELVNAYQRSAFTVLFSNYENMPVVVAESFSCGIPVVATNVGGLPEVVNEHNGILTDPGNEEMLVRNMDRMLDRYTKYNQNVIRDKAISMFGKVNFEKAYHNFYSYICC
jgi:glycosyltransferase involved in cell wall biosynthesis